MGGQDLVLDAAVRDWVLLPLTLSVVLMMVLRQYMTKVCSEPSNESQVDALVFVAEVISCHNCCPISHSDCTVDER